MSSEFFKRLLNPFWFKQLLRAPNPKLRTLDGNRRFFLKCLLGVPFFFPFHARRTLAEAVIPSRGKGQGPIGEFFNGEELVYEIGAWPFKRAALGKLSIQETGKKGHYMAMIEAETLGVLGWLTRYRKDTYRSTMEEIDGRSRFRSLSFEEDVKIGSKLRKRIHHFDYQKNKWTQFRRRKDGSMGKTEAEIPPGMAYDDFVTASYNFRFGVYGEIERGRKYVVSTFPRKGSSNYEVNVAGKEEEETRKRSEKVKAGKEFYVKLFLDPEITHSKEGLIEGWLSKESYPMEGRIKDVVLYGDVRGTLIKRTRG